MVAAAMNEHGHPPMNISSDKTTHAHVEHGATQDPKQNTAEGHASDEYISAVYHSDPAAERRLRLKIDLYVVPTVFLLYLFCFIDRTNVGNARLAGFEKDLHLQRYDYNAVLSYFYISYIILEIPANTMCKIIGPGWFLPFCTVQGYSSVAAVRFLLGVFEAGMLPGIAYYLSRWYRRSELVFRLSLYIIAAPLAGAFSGLLASAILRLDHFASFKSWRIIFAIEGIATIVVGALAFFTMTDRPQSSRWLSVEEKKLAIGRVQSENIGTQQIMDKIDVSKLLRGICSPITIGTAVVFLLDNITVQGLAIFALTVVRTIYSKETVVTQQFHTVLPYIVGGTSVLIVSFCSWKTNKRTIYFLPCAMLMMIGYIIFVATTESRVRYGATFIIAAGAFPFGAFCNTQVSANVASDTARASAIATNVMFGNMGGLVSTWSFLPFDAPNYKIGNGLNLATSASIITISIYLLIWMKVDNGRKERLSASSELDGLNQKQIEDLDWRHPDFQWKP
ncbi:MFS general substrate transporter [Cadophora sp. DSE1049]|nr:MFS general substrate transporter [Cadophora sp. DSE1049]